MAISLTDRMHERGDVVKYIRWIYIHIRNALILEAVDSNEEGTGL